MEDFALHWQNVEIAVTAAYCSDMIAALIFKVVPFSRCSKSSDILSHHLPVMVLVLLAIPMGTLWESREPYLAMVAERPLFWTRMPLITVGFGFISSLNEFIMCMQKVDLPRNVWSSRPVVVFELAYKCLIFTLFSGLASLAGGHVLYSFACRCASQNPAILEVATCVAVSPIMWRVLIGVSFFAIMYPKMAKRALLKLHSNTDTETMVGIFAPVFTVMPVAYMQVF